jgi:hypothetical protein
MASDPEFEAQTGAAAKPHEKIRIANFDSQLGA